MHANKDTLLYKYIASDIASHSTHNGTIDLLMSGL